MAEGVSMMLQFGVIVVGIIFLVLIFKVFEFIWKAIPLYEQISEKLTSIIRILRENQEYLKSGK